MQRAGAVRKGRRKGSGMVARRRNSGFSLLELIIAMAVIAVAMFGVLSMILHTMQTKETMRELQIAKEAAATKIEEVKAHPMQLPPALLPVGATPDPTSIYNTYFRTDPINDPYTFTVDGLSSGRGTVRIDATNPYLYEIMVTVRWVGRKGPAEYTRRSMVAQ